MVVRNEGQKTLICENSLGILRENIFMKFRDRLLSLNRLIERELGRSISVKEYTYCHYELDQKNLNHVQMDFGRLHKMGLVHRRKEKYDGRRVFVYSLTPKGRKYVRWVKSNSNEKDDSDSEMAQIRKILGEMWNTYIVGYLLQTGRTDELKNWKLVTLEDGRKAWMPVKGSREDVTVQQAEKPTMRFFENGGAERLTEREYNKFKIARSFLNGAGMPDGHMRDLVSLYFCRDSWSKM